MFIKERISAFIKRNIFFILGILFIAVIIFVIEILSSAISPFLISILSGLILIISGSFIVPKILNYLQKPNFDFFVSSNEGIRQDNVKLTMSQDGKWEATLKFNIRNKKTVIYRNVYYNLVIPSIFDTKVIKNISDKENLLQPAPFGKEFLRLAGLINYPIFPDRTTDFPLHLQIKSKTNDFDDKNLSIYYFFSTEKGVYPKSTNIINSFVNNEPFNGKILGEIKIDRIIEKTIK